MHTVRTLINIITLIAFLTAGWILWQPQHHAWLAEQVQPVNPEDIFLPIWVKHMTAGGVNQITRVDHNALSEGNRRTHRIDHNWALEAATEGLWSFDGKHACIGLYLPQATAEHPDRHAWTVCWMLSSTKPREGVLGLDLEENIYRMDADTLHGYASITVALRGDYFSFRDRLLGRYVPLIFADNHIDFSPIYWHWLETPYSMNDGQHTRAYTGALAEISLSQRLAWQSARQIMRYYMAGMVFVLGLILSIRILWLLPATSGHPSPTVMAAKALLLGHGRAYIRRLVTERNRLVEERRHREETLIRQGQKFSVGDEVRRLIDKSDLGGATALVTYAKRIHAEQLARKEAERERREARALFMADAERYSQSIMTSVADRYDLGDIAGARRIIEEAERKEQRRQEIAALAESSGNINDRIRKNEAETLILEASGRLDATPHEWRKLIHEIEALLLTPKPNGARGVNRPR